MLPSKTRNPLLYRHLVANGAHYACRQCGKKCATGGVPTNYGEQFCGPACRCRYYDARREAAREDEEAGRELAREALGTFFINWPQMKRRTR